MASLYIGQFKGYGNNSEFGVFNVYFQYNASGITLSDMSIKLSKDVKGKYTTNSYYVDSITIGGTTYDYSPKSGSANYNTAGAGPTINIFGTHASGSSVYVEVKMHRSGQSKGGQTLSGTVTGLATSPTGLWCNITGRTETAVSISGGYTSDGGSGVTTSGYQYSTNGSTWYNCSNYISDLSPGTTYYFRYYAGNSVGTSYSGNASTTTYNYPAITSVPNLKIGDQLTIGFSNPRGLTCYIYLILDDGNEYGGDHTTGTYISGYNDAGWLDHWYNSIPKSKSGSYKVRLYVPDVGRNTTVNGGTYSIKNNGTEIPTFAENYWSYVANLTQLTNNNQVIINGYSKVDFSINIPASSNYGSPISYYNYKWGNSLNRTGSIIGGNGNVLEVSAVDSRGLSKTTQKTLASGTNYIPYTTPILDYSNSYTQRLKGISAETYLTLQGNLSVMKFGSDGIANAIHSCKYKVYNYNTCVWSDEFTIPVSEISLNSSGYFSLNNYMIHANGSSGGFPVGVRYGIQIILQDANGLLATLTSNLIQITDGKIARDVYQDSNGDYHQGINGMADSNYTEKIYGNLNVQGDIISTSNIESNDVVGKVRNRAIASIGSDGANSNGWYKVASSTMSNYGNTDITLLVQDNYSRNSKGILSINMRSDNTSVLCYSLTWLSRDKGIFPGDAIIVINGMTWTLYFYRRQSRYGRMSFHLLSHTNINGYDPLYNVSFYLNNTTKETTTPTATVTSTDTITNMIYPVGSIYISYKATNPATLFGGTWEQLKNHFLFATNDTSGDKGGYGNGTGTSSGSTTLTAAQSGLPSHQHALQNANPGGTTVGWTKYGVDAITNKGYTGNVRTGYTGGLSASEGHTHTIPYIEVYVWRRTA